ncbi:MAG TPA: GIY-YIG nuclease family protein [Candidatus Krumholzibacteriaceae bacterium]|jgi:putative endonuclease|nr:GIY-YIG nuclease family protein [Candidatus Krumholzibacteriaceae bacterium]
MPYYVYILLCKGGTFYTGYTKNLNTRISQHMNGKGAKYTKMHKPKKIAYTEEFASRAKAMQRERGIKRLNHKQKLQLIKRQDKQNP